MAELTARKNQHHKRPHEPALRQKPEQKHQHKKESGDVPLGPGERGVENVPAIELSDRQQVEHGDEHPQPPSEGHRAQRHRSRGVRELPEQQRHNRVPERPDPPPDRNLHSRRDRLRRRVAMRESNPEHGERDDETGDRSRRADVEQLPAVVQNRAESDEGTERPDSDGRRRSRKEMGRRHIHLVLARGQIVTHLVTKEDGEEWERE